MPGGGGKGGVVEGATDEVVYQAVDQRPLNKRLAGPGCSLGGHFQSATYKLETLESV